MLPRDKQDRGSVLGVVSGSGPGLLNKILDFLFDRFKNLPPPLRAVAYFIFLTFFCATAWRLVAGQYVVRGVVWNGDDYATGCEIRFRGDYFSTNSKGMFYAVLSPAQYYRVAAAGETDLPVTCRNPDGHFKRVKGPFNVKLSLWDDEFGEIHLDAPAAVKHSGQAAGAVSFSLIASAYADSPPAPAPKPALASPSAPRPNRSSLPSPDDRLVVEQITLGRSADDMRQVDFEIDLGRKERPLLLQGLEAGPLPMKSKVRLGERYYFDVPQNRRGARVSVKMEDSGLFGKKETFKFQVPTQYEPNFLVKGTKGSVLVLRLAPPR